MRWVMAENPNYIWDRSNYFGASLRSLTELGRKKGYSLVGTDSRGVNAFFVRDDFVGKGRFLDPVLQYPELTLDQQARVIQSCSAFLRKGVGKAA
jgi:hypothetical protein